MKVQSSLQSGFSLIEMLLVIALIGMLAGFTSLSLANTQQTTSVATAAESLNSDLKSQQAKAMLGKVKSGSSSSNYGIYFEEHDYILFSGSSYDPIAQDNLKVDVDGITISSTFPGTGHPVIFQQINGEVNGISSGHDTITLTDANASHPKTITINKYGVVR
jgi:type II secretion system protein H